MPRPREAGLPAPCAPGLAGAGMCAGHSVGDGPFLILPFTGAFCLSASVSRGSRFNPILDMLAAFKKGVVGGVKVHVDRLQVAGPQCVCVPPAQG